METSPNVNVNSSSNQPVSPPTLPSNLQFQNVIGNNNNTIFEGNTFNTVVNYTSPLTKTTEGNLHWKLPKRNKKFTGRTQLLTELEKVLTTSNSNNNTPHANTLVITAFHGIGGIGKTQLVTEYIHRHLDDYSCIIWIPAETNKQIVETYVELTKDLKLLVEYPSQPIRQVQKWLTQQKKYLLVFDNASDYNTLEEYLPSTGISNHHIIITSRDSKWQKTKLEVGIFTSTEARDYLRQFVKKEETDAAIETLAQTLGYLPLALAQAGAYIDVSEWNIKKYLSEYHKNKKLYLQDEELPVGDKHAPVFFTWDVTFKAIQKKPSAIQLLRLSVYSPGQEIPLNFLQTGHLLMLSKNFQEKGVIEKEWADVKSLLKRYMLWTINERDNIVFIHPLVQEVIRIKLEQEGEAQYWLNEMLKLINFKLEDITQNVITLQQQKFKEYIADFFNFFVKEYWRKFSSAIPQKTVNLLEKALEIYLDSEKIYLENSNKFITQLSEKILRTEILLGGAYGMSMQFAKQKAFLKRIAEKYNRLENQRAFAKILTPLAYAMGDAKQQKELAEKALNIFESIKYKDIETIDIADAHRCQGIAEGKVRDKRAIDHLQKAVDLYESAKDIDELARTYVNLGIAHKDRNENEKAKEAFELALQKFKAIHKENYINHAGAVIAFVNLIDESSARNSEFYKLKIETLKQAANIIAMLYRENHPQYNLILLNVEQLQIVAPLVKQSNNNKSSSMERLEWSNVIQSFSPNLSFPVNQKTDSFMRECLFKLEQDNILEKDCQKSLPANFIFGAAYGKGDCFFDACAQALNALRGGNQYDVKSLRLLSDEYVKSNKGSWIKDIIKKDKIADSYEDYLTWISFTQQEMEINKANGLSDGVAIWGRPHIDGRIICEKQDVKLHVMEIDHENNDRIMHQQITAQAGSKSIDEEQANASFNEKDCIHIACYKNHFVPIIRNPHLALSLQTNTALPVSDNPEIKVSKQEVEEPKKIILTKQHELDVSLQEVLGGIKVQTVEGNNNRVTFAHNITNINVHYSSPLIQTTEGNIHWNLPKRNKKFTGRTQLLTELEKILTASNSNNNALHTNTLVVTAFHGIGGIGKTQLVTEYIHRHLNDYSCIIWIPAETREQIEATYFELTKDLRIPIEHPSQTIRQVQKWLTQQKKYLLVFDNALNYNTLEEYLPSTGISNHHVIITSRDSEWQDTKLEVGIFTSTEARDYLRQFVKKEETDEAINTLANTLGYLPLALAQAGAYIAYSKWSIEKYLGKYTENQKLYIQDNKLPIGDKHAPVFVTWDITFKTIQQELPIANKLLTLSAYCHSEGIPLNLLQTGHVLMPSKDVNSQEFPEEGFLEKSWTDAKGLLQRYMLWTSDEKDTAISIHRLIQEVIRLQQSPESTQTYLQQLIQSAQLLYPYGKKNLSDYATKRIWLPHLTAFLVHLDSSLKYKSMNHDYTSNERDTLLCLLEYLWEGYCDLGDAKQQKALLERALKIKEVHYGKDHPEVAKTLTNLGNAHGALGEAKQQKALLERALKIQEVHYGSEHPEVAPTLGSLGNAHGALGEAEQQKALLERALKIKEVHYGKDHPEVAKTLTNLGNAHGALGDPKQQKALLECALKIQEVHYGKDHPEVAKTLTNLGNAHGALGEAEQQKELLERALKIKEVYYGKDHLEVAKTLTSLGNAHGALGDPKQQKALLERALKIKEGHYGLNHLDVAKTLKNLSTAYGVLGDVKKSKDLLERALKILETEYGKDHPEVGVTLLNLAEALFQLTDIKTAHAYAERAYQIFLAHPQCGSNHPWTQANEKKFKKINSLFKDSNNNSTSTRLPSSFFRISNISNLSENTLPKELMFKYKLNDATQASWEKGLRQAAYNNNFKDIEYFLKGVKNINALEDKTQRTALHWAVLGKSVECIKLLLEAGADLTIPDAKGKTPLDYAVENKNKNKSKNKNENGMEEIILLLTEYTEKKKQLGK